ncbi:MAG: hypothetical protein ABW217_15420 [Polyangiaceae bacterium]
MPAQRRSSAPPPPLAKVVVRSEDLADAPASSELPAAALVDSKPELLGDLRSSEPLNPRAAAPRPARAEVPRPALSATPATLGRDAERAPARRSSIPPAPAEPAKRRSSVPPAPLASATPEAEPTRGSKSPIPRPAIARALEQGQAAAVASTMVGGAELAGRDETADPSAQASQEPVLPAAAETSPVAAAAEAAVAEAPEAADAEAPEAERETLLGVLPTAADEREAADDRETLLGVPAARAEMPVPRRSETPPAMAQRTAHTASSYADESRALLTSGAYGAREVHSSEWDSPDTLPRPIATGEGEQGATSPEMRVAHLLRRLRRTIPLYAPLPENIRKLIDSDQSH